jgi:hypothetical protein
VSGLQLPPAEPPAEDVADVLDQLTAARQQLADAHDVVARIADNAATGDVERQLPVWRTEHAERYWLIEARAAELRCELWSLAIAELTDRARALGAHL